MTYFRRLPTVANTCKFTSSIAFVPFNQSKAESARYSHFGSRRRIKSHPRLILLGCACQRPAGRVVRDQSRRPQGTAGVTRVFLPRKIRPKGHEHYHVSVTMNFLNIELRPKKWFPSHTSSITPTFRELWEHGAPHWIGTAATHWM